MNPYEERTACALFITFIASFVFSVPPAAFRAKLHATASQLAASTCVLLSHLLIARWGQRRIA